MKATLIIPTPQTELKIHLYPTTEDPRSHYGQAVLLVEGHEESPHDLLKSVFGKEFGRLWPEDQDILDGATFRLLRAALNARLETDSPDSACNALGIPKGELGINLSAQSMGRIKTAKKAISSRENGKKGGRPVTATSYHVVRLDYGIRDSDGNYHQTHEFTKHRTLSAAIKSLVRLQKEYNSLDIVDQTGKSVEFTYLVDVGQN